MQIKELYGLQFGHRNFLRYFPEFLKVKVFFPGYFIVSNQINTGGNNMQTFREEAREIPVLANVDVLVIGGGPAGVGAALAAAENGAETMLVEQSGKIGGLGGEEENLAGKAGNLPEKAAGRE